MDHETIKQKLFEYRDGELIRVERLEVEAHLKQCAECRRASADWQCAATALFKQPEQEASELFVHKVMGRIAESQARRLRFSWAGLPWLVPAFGLAAMMFVVLHPIERVVTLDALLFDDGQPQAATQLVLAGEKPSQDDLLGFMMEDSL